MKINKITDSDLQDKGVVGLADIPSLSTDEMQRKFEEISTAVIIPKVNEIIDNIFTKSETTQQINEKVVDIGAGDMAMAVYDTDGDGRVDRAENAELLGGQPLAFFATATQLQQVESLADAKIPKGDVTQIFVVDTEPVNGIDGALYLVRKV